MNDCLEEAKSWVLTNLSDFVGLLDMALEGDELDPDDRLFYVGHMATCARIYRAVILNEPAANLFRLIELESKAYSMASRPNERGEIVKEGWLSIQPILKQYATGLQR